ncbi:acylglycerol kinase family protein [Candidatus Saccharibacteria bacterium]|nr:acylglycerol kinase family protein [Candidatus Saccharibacteria bacterium]
MKKFNRFVVVCSPESSRADEYDQKITHELRQIAATCNAELVEISLKDKPYFATVQLVRDSLKDGDVVIGAGGDGINQATLQGAFESKRDITAGFLSLGNANDFATALNGHIKSPLKILTSPTINFQPLELSINDKPRFFIASYATLGVTTIAVEQLNSAEIRHSRKHLAKLSPIAALRSESLSKISHAINDLKFTPFKRDCLVHHDDSVGFFLIPAAKGILRPSGISNFLIRDDFFFHFDNVRKKSPGRGWISKGLVAGRWATFGLPGSISDYEKLEFLRPSDMIIHIGGDTVNLNAVKTISAERVQRSIKVFAPRKSLQV